MAETLFCISSDTNISNEESEVCRSRKRLCKTMSKCSSMRGMQVGITLPSVPPALLQQHCREDTAPAKPLDFGSGFSLPGHSVRLLEVINGHERDTRIQFFADGHIYYIDGKRSLGSVTGLVHEFSYEFCADRVIQKMMSGFWWPRPEYTHESGQPFTKDEIKSKWERNRIESANRGTWMHFTFELWLNRCPVDLDAPEMQLFLNFVDSLTGLRAYRTEWEIFGDDERLAGSIDFVAESVDDRSLTIIDWKRTKSIASKYVGQNFMKSPLQHISDCSGMHYRLQLNCYRYLLEKYYDRRVSTMLVVCTHPDVGSQAYIDNVPVMLVETEAMMSWQRSRAEQA